MPARLSYRSLLALGALAMMFCLAPAAASAAIADTQVIDTHTCTTDAFASTCVDEHTVFHTTSTPTGLAVGNSETTLVVALTGTPGGEFDGCSESATVNFGGHFVDVNDINLVSFTRLRGTTALSCGGGLVFDCTN